MKHLNQNQEFRFNEVLFEHRNKEYGAYALRNESDRILTKALFVGVSLLAAVSITPFVISALQGPEVIQQTWELPPPMIIPEEPIQKDPPAQIVKPTPTEKVKTYDATVPEPKAVVRNEKTKEIDKVNAVASVQTSQGKETETTSYVAPITPQVIGGGTGPSIKTDPIVEKTDPKKIETELSVEANFMGGIDSFRNKVMNNFDSSGFDAEDVMKTTITFIVEMDGSISGIKANGTNADFNNEAIRTIKSISKNGKWIPAKNKKGESVRSYFKFPISMKFD
ncbi:energy transducer TonB [Chryseobacterium rhizosphaerae]|uniref:Protein TonB n=1 Tax=Chryseobacterium rhizosphaerae TaxID=395937 RepID=A0AAE3YC08_9FLAO|nr:energy transducer TonB [Chryseobacterium rhizosphaerae]MDR6527952.1 protein TonB [Chryseobacterium rhizosphaerae]